MNLLNDLEEKEEVDQLLTWWNRQVFAAYIDHESQCTKNSVLARIREKRAAQKEAAGTSAVNINDDQES